MCQKPAGAGRPCNLPLTLAQVGLQCLVCEESFFCLRTPPPWGISTWVRSSVAFKMPYKHI